MRGTRGPRTCLPVRILFGRRCSMRLQDARAIMDPTITMGTGAPVRLAAVPTAQLVEELERRLYCKDKPRRNLVLVGKPGSGKGTVGRHLAEKHCLCHVAVGDVLRAEQRQDTLLGKRVSRQVARGELVADNTALFLVRRETAKPECRKGFVLDGMPRSACQAAQLDSFLTHAGIGGIDRVVHLEVDDDTCKRRLEQRLVHPSSGRIYNLETAPPKQPFTDDVTGEQLVRRADDVEGTLLRTTSEDEFGSIERRLAVYAEEAGGVLAYYGNRGKVVEVDARQPPAAVMAAVDAVLEEGK